MVFYSFGLMEPILKSNGNETLQNYSMNTIRIKIRQ